MLEQANRDHDLQEAARIQYGEIPRILKEIQKCQASLVKAQADESMLTEEVKDSDIAKVVSAWTGIPVEKLLGNEKKRLLDIEEFLKKRVIGQDEAIESVADALRRSRIGLQDEDKPMGSFIFLGPTGVGKTELVKGLASLMFDDEKALVRIDMSEYMEKHAVSKLLGAAPGYIGHGEGGQLTEPVRRRPYSVVLFDEIEKAHPEVLNILLQLLDDGILTDSTGRKVDFRNTLVLMTSNLGSRAFTKNRSPLGYSHDIAESTRHQIKESAIKSLKEHFKPEMLNRIDEVIVFNRLTSDDVKKIVNIQFDNFVNRLQDKCMMSAVLTDAAQNHLATSGYDEKFGARPIKRKMQSLIESPLAKDILKDRFTEGDIIEVYFNETSGSLGFQKVTETTVRSA
jgi:ATP-dependent Clp protease ATP-binding subunit ClpB